MPNTPQQTVAVASAVAVATNHSLYAELRPLPVNAVCLLDAFWKPRQTINHTTTLPGQYQHCEETGRIDNFRRAAGVIEGEFKGRFFNDSDVYKWLEGMAWELARQPDPELEELLNTVADTIVAAQQPDGYLNTYFMFERAGERWQNTDLHELYCAGHFMQAAVAHYRATGSRTLLDAAIHLANHICETFGPAEMGKRERSDGHPEIEMALVELYRTTSDFRYLEQAQFFINVRGEGKVAPHSFGVFGAEYAQDHLPFRQLDRLYGHAVRALYLNGGAADVYLETGEPALLTALEGQWQHMVEKQMYVSGGLGSGWKGESFGDDYELPNWAYAETCAAIASVMWSWRMLMLKGEARYSDLIERTLYNGLLSGLSLDGATYFYQNPLVDPAGTHRRSPWFETSCCPTNLARFLPSLNQYIYSTSEDGVWVHLYATNEAEFLLSNGALVGITQTTDYPWDGDVTLTVNSTRAFTLYLRIPAWCASASLTVNGEVVAETEPLVAGRYARVARLWQGGDQVHLHLPMPARRETSHPLVEENQGRAAILRGPLLYCLEAVDNPDMNLGDVVVPFDAPVEETFEPELLGGVVRLSFKGNMSSGEAVDVIAVPYYAWANRDAGPMQVWVRHG